MKIAKLCNIVLAVMILAIAAGCGSGEDTGYQSVPKSQGGTAANGNQPIVEPAEQGGQTQNAGEAGGGNAQANFGGRK